MHRFTKKTTLVTLALMIGCFLLTVATASAAPKRIGITKFETNNYTVRVRGGYYDIGLGASDMLTTELAKNRNFEVVEREQIRSVLQEQGFGASGAVDPSTAPQMGKLLGLKYIVYGKILSAGAEEKHDQIMGLHIDKLTAKVRISVRMIDATTGSIVWADQVEGKVEKSGGGIEGLGGTSTEVSASIYDDALHGAINQIVSHINQGAPTEGAIAKVSGRKVYLDIGVDQGVQPGQTYVVYREGEAITNSAGQVIGVDKTDLCTVKVTRVDGGMAIAEIQDKSMPLLQAGDKVRSN
ncbi:MAG: CsgG/HfaB family protein [Sporomusaceae bacterium]|nr:CsgG/HfaB family protein [Sporomusaceae bacterium]